MKCVGFVHHKPSSLCDPVLMPDCHPHALGSIQSREEKLICRKIIGINAEHRFFPGHFRVSDPQCW